MVVVISLYEGPCRLNIISYFPPLCPEPMTCLSCPIVYHWLQPSDWSSRYTLFLLIALVVGRALVVFGIFGFCGLFNRQKFSMSFPVRSRSYDDLRLI